MFHFHFIGNVNKVNLYFSSTIIFFQRRLQISSSLRYVLKKGCLYLCGGNSRASVPNFFHHRSESFHPGSRIRIKEFKYFKGTVQIDGSSRK
jgi:hypothetical protein